VCLFASVSPELHVRPIFARFAVPVTYGSSPLAALRCVVCTSGLMDDVAFAHNGPRLWRHADTVAASDVIASSCAG